MIYYYLSLNFVEHDMNGDKYLLKIGDGDIKYPKLYVLNNTSYDIYNCVRVTQGATIEDVYSYLVNRYHGEKDKILMEDIESCVNDFVCAGIFIKQQKTKEPLYELSNKRDY